jgi:fatty acid desaturase
MDCATKDSIPSSSEPSSKDQVLLFLRAYETPSDFQGLLAVFGNWGLIVAFSMMSEYYFYSLPTLLSWFTYFFIAVILSSRYRGFENLVHEASHRNLFKTHALTRLCKLFYANIVFKHLPSWSHEHRLHHKFLGNLEKDPDYQRYEKLGMLDLKHQFKWKVFGRPLCGLEHLYFLQTTIPHYWKHEPAWKYFWVGVVACCLSYEPLLYIVVLYFVIPFFGILPVTRYWCEMSEHTGLSLEYFIGQSRSNVGFLHRWWLHPFGDGFHEIHHLAPHIPWHRLKEAHSALQSAFPNEPYQTSFSVAQTVKQMQQ